MERYYIRYFQRKEDSETYYHVGTKWLYFESVHAWIDAINFLVSRNNYNATTELGSDGTIAGATITDNDGIFKWLTGKAYGREEDIKCFYSHIKPFGEVQTLY